MKNFGFIPSLITDETPKFEGKKTMFIPSKFSYKDFLSPVQNQGSDPYCIPYSISTWLNWKENIKSGKKLDYHIKYADIYNSKKCVGEGMTYQEAFKYLKEKGVKTDVGIMKISSVGYLPNTQLIKQALIANGPCFGALPVYDSSLDNFWKKTKSLEGWHSITIVGWDDRGYIIRNSWGTSFAEKGYVILPYSDASAFREIWTILG